MKQKMSESFFMVTKNVMAFPIGLGKFLFRVIYPKDRSKYLACSNWSFLDKKNIFELEIN